MLDENTKLVILQRLFDDVSLCTCCNKGWQHCTSSSNRTLPDFIPVDSVLKAINEGQHFFKED